MQIPNLGLLNYLLLTSFLIKCQNLQVDIGNHWACEIALEKCKLCQMAANCQMVVASLYEVYYGGTRGL